MLLHRRSATRRRAGSERTRARPRDAVPAPADRLAPAPEARARAAVPLRRVDRRPGSHRAAPERAPRQPRARRRDDDDTTPLTRHAASDPSQIVDAIRARQRFVLSSHSRPDGDSIGSQLAMAYALRALGKDVTVVNADRGAAAAAWRFPASTDIAIADERGRRRSTRRSSWSAATWRAPASTGLDRSFVINIDHHPGQHRLRRTSTGSTRRRPRAARWCSTWCARSACR